MTFVGFTKFSTANKQTGSGKFDFLTKVALFSNLKFRSWKKGCEKMFRKLQFQNKSKVIFLNFSFFLEFYGNLNRNGQISCYSLKGKSLSEALLFAEHGENMLCLNVGNNFCTQHVLPSFELEIFMYRTCNSMNNLSSYCGLVDAKIRAFDKDLPVHL